MQISAQTLLASQQAAQIQAKPAPVPGFSTTLEKSEGFAPLPLKQAAPDAVIFGGGAERLCSTSGFALPGLAAETALIGLDLDGVMVSSGSTCSSGKVAVSHVLTAMGVEDALAACALRASFGWSSTMEDVNAAVASLIKLRERIRGKEAA